jgi:hypothetical protein
MFIAMWTGRDHRLKSAPFGNSPAAVTYLQQHILASGVVMCQRPDGTLTLAVTVPDDGPEILAEVPGKVQYELTTRQYGYLVNTMMTDMAGVVRALAKAEQGESFVVVSVRMA